MGKTLAYFREWLTKSVIYEQKLSMNGVGQITYASDPEVTLDCYIHGTIQEVTNDKGEEVISNQQLYLDGADSTVSTIDFGDRFKIDGRYRKILSIDKFYDEDGDLDLVVIYL